MFLSSSSLDNTAYFLFPILLAVGFLMRPATDLLMSTTGSSLKILILEKTDSGIALISRLNRIEPAPIATQMRCCVMVRGQHLTKEPPNWTKRTTIRGTLHDDCAAEDDPEQDVVAGVGEDVVLFLLQLSAVDLVEELDADEGLEEDGEVRAELGGPLLQSGLRIRERRRARRRGRGRGTG